jgi:hypothetical protein
MSELIAVPFFALLGLACFATAYKSAREFMDSPDDPVVIFCLLPIGLFMLISGIMAALIVGSTLWKSAQ